MLVDIKLAGLGKLITNRGYINRLLKKGAQGRVDHLPSLILRMIDFRHGYLLVLLPTVMSHTDFT